MSAIQKHTHTLTRIHVGFPVKNRFGFNPHECSGTGYSTRAHKIVCQWPSFRYWCSADICVMQKMSNDQLIRQLWLWVWSSRPTAKFVTLAALQDTSPQRDGFSHLMTRLLWPWIQALRIRKRAYQTISELLPNMMHDMYPTHWHWHINVEVWHTRPK